MHIEITLMVAAKMFCFSVLEKETIIFRYHDFLARLEKLEKRKGQVMELDQFI